jgi:antitoxin ChpS
MRTTTLRQSGGSIIVSIPKAYIDQLGLTADTPVDISLEGNRIIIARRGRIGLAARLATCDFRKPMTKEERRWLREWDEAPPVGDEII